MRIRKAVGALAVAIAFLGINAGITSASAATRTTSSTRTWTVTPGGKATAKSGLIKLTDTKTRSVGKCASSKVTGKIKSGKRLRGNDIASVTSAGFYDCTAFVRLHFTVTARGLPWRINLTSYDRATGVVSGTVSHIRVIVTGTLCSAVVNGTDGATADGVLKATYSDRTGSLIFLAAGGNLRYWDVKGCGRLLNNGDPVALTAVYTISPKEIVTSP
jgi:hypothetical protein